MKASTTKTMKAKEDSGFNVRSSKQLTAGPLVLQWCFQEVSKVLGQLWRVAVLVRLAKLCLFE